MAEMSQIILSPKVLRKPKNIQVEKGEPVLSFPAERIAAMSSYSTWENPSETETL